MLDRVRLLIRCIFGLTRPQKLEETREEAKSKATIFKLCGTSMFYWPNICRELGELVLRDRPNGSFLVWGNTKNGQDVTLELLYKRDGSIMNMKIHQNKDGFSLDHNNTNLPTGRTLDELILTLIEKCKQHSLIVADETRQKFGLMKLKYPLKRNVTLMDHCKKKIISTMVGVDYNTLDLPKEVIEFLLE